MSSATLSTHRHPLRFALGASTLLTATLFFPCLFWLKGASLSQGRGAELTLIFYASAPISLLAGALLAKVLWHALRGVPPFQANASGVQLLDAWAGPMELRWHEISAIVFGEITMGSRSVPGIFFVQEKPLRKAGLFVSKDTNPLVLNGGSIRESVAEVRAWLEAHPLAAAKIQKERKVA